jgi:hydrogenase maturation protease
VTKITRSGAREHHDRLFVLKQFCYRVPLIGSFGSPCADANSREKAIMRIIGCGNPNRMDDAAGVLVAERLRDMGIPAEIQSGGAFELVESWDADDDVVLVDAVSTGSPLGTVHLWQGTPPKVPIHSQLSSHGFGVGEAINLALLVGRLPKRLCVYGIEGAKFGYGEAVSPEVLNSVERVARQILVTVDDKLAREAQRHSLQISNSRS